MSVNLAAYNGVSHFSVIHDSFGCHAADIPMFNACIRQAFVNLYEDYDPLADFKSQTEQAANINLPPLPDKGDLDVKVVVSQRVLLRIIFQQKLASLVKTLPYS